MWLVARVVVCVIAWAPGCACVCVWGVLCHLCVCCGCACLFVLIECVRVCESVLPVVCSSLSLFGWLVICFCGMLLCWRVSLAMCAVV